LTTRLVRTAVIKDRVLAIAKFTFFENAFIQTFKVILGQPIIFQESLHFIINVFCKARSFISVLNLELIDEETLQLLTFLNI